MTLDEIARLLESELPGCQVTVTGDPSGHHIEIMVVGTLFEGMNKVKRQQRVYSALKQQIAEGVIHAVTMQTLTPAEQGQGVS